MACSMTVRFVALPREQRVAYERAIDRLAGWVMEEETDERESAGIRQDGAEQAAAITFAGGGTDGGLDIYRVQQTAVPV